MAYPYFQPYQPYYPAQPIQQMQPPQIPAQPMQNQPIPQNPTQGISPASRPVGNREEANSVPADFSGAPMVFTDATHGMVYIKRWNFQTGAAEFEDYARVNPAEVEKQFGHESPEYVLLSDFKQLESRIEKLESRKSPGRPKREDLNDADE